LLLVLFLAGCSTSTTLEVSPRATQPVDTDGKSAALVIDAADGEVLFQSNADAPRYPASLTKMMTLYMLFEAMQSGRVSPDAQIPVSAYAASRPPTKIGFRPGETIGVDVAIHALAVKSANDVSVAVAEFLSGSEERFAADMTARARSIGMRGTVFRNANGLPDARQLTSARDMARLGLTLRKRFPREFAYFSARSFVHRGRAIRGHNNLLGRVAGVDGIKTGYIRASGFNIVTSVNLDGRSLVVVVMGGTTAKARDAQVEALIAQYLPRATRRGGGMFAFTQ